MAGYDDCILDGGSHETCIALYPEGPEAGKDEEAPDSLHSLANQEVFDFGSGKTGKIIERPIKDAKGKIVDYSYRLGYKTRYVLEGKIVHRTDYINLDPGRFLATKGGGFFETGGGGVLAFRTPEQVAAFFPGFFPELAPELKESAAANQAASDARQAQREAASDARRSQENILQREADAELQKLREENALRREKLSVAGSLAARAAEVKQLARNQITELIGRDVVRGGIAQSGGVQRHITPAQQFNTTLQGIVDAPIPTVDENAAIPDIQATIEALNAGPTALPTQPALGFAAGGTMSYNGMTLGNERRAVMLGEGTGSGEEIGIIDPSMGPGITEVIPMMGGAQEGAIPTADSIRQALSKVYGSLGFQDLPNTVRGPANTYSIQGGQRGGLGAARTLGYNPRLIRNTGTNGVFYADPSGKFRGFRTGEDFLRQGFKWTDVLNLDPNEFAGLNISDEFQGDVPAIEGPSKGFSTMAQPLIEPGTGLAMPDPAQIAGIWRFLDPDTQTVLKSAYGTANLDLESVIARMEYATPKGTGTYAGARFG